ncbi:MAG: hypothetical protein AAGI03_10565 [Pseudomonadota bacterium]
MLRATLAIALVWAFISLVAGLVMQVELFSPGLQVYVSGGIPAPEMHGDFWSIHSVVAVSALPVTALGAVGCLHLAGFRSPASAIAKSERVAAGVLLLLGAIFVASSLVLHPRGLAVDLTLLGVLAVAVSILAASMACFRDASSRRAAAPWLVFALFLSFLTGFMRTTLDGEGVDTALTDTQFAVATWHAGGGALALLMLGLLSAVAQRAGRVLNGWLSAAQAGAITLTWTGMVISQAQLGLMGMPRLYADYPEAFSALQVRAGVCAGLAVFLFALALLRLVIARVQRSTESPASAF